MALLSHVTLPLFKLQLLKTALQALITQTRAKQAATMSEVEWRGRTVPVKIDKVRIFLLGLADNEAAIVQVRRRGLWCFQLCVSEGLLELKL